MLLLFQKGPMADKYLVCDYIIMFQVAVPWKDVPWIIKEENLIKCGKSSMSIASFPTRAKCPNMRIGKPLGRFKTKALILYPFPNSWGIIHKVGPKLELDGRNEWVGPCMRSRPPFVRDRIPQRLPTSIG